MHTVTHTPDTHICLYTDIQGGVEGIGRGQSAFFHPLQSSLWKLLEDHISLNQSEWLVTKGAKN